MGQRTMEEINLTAAGHDFCPLFEQTLTTIQVGSNGVDIFAALTLCFLSQRRYTSSENSSSAEGRRRKAGAAALSHQETISLMGEARQSVWGPDSALCPPGYCINTCTCCLHYFHPEHPNRRCKAALLETALRGRRLEITIMFPMSSGGETGRVSIQPITWFR